MPDKESADAPNFIYPGGMKGLVDLGGTRTYDLADAQTPKFNCESELCEISKNWTRQGGGYLLWSRYVKCSISTPVRVILIILAVFWMLILFLTISFVADDFFSPAVDGIVSHLRISDTVAGVTLMAFGNGAPDVFGSIASVLNSPQPKADLALGQLFGGGLCIISIVLASIIITKPFKSAVFGPIRDVLFYLIALGFSLFCFLYTDRMPLWMPLGFLVIYFLYVLTVIVLQVLIINRYKRKKARKALKTASDTVVAIAIDQSIF
ncbi:unnamed protein product [Caenorhabditis auriculariae]|uniref:Sodium/calcium exchanger membrane region domain-containing protein n=1 Tax=Caenorhabditis auriculariae TaxID=2777116 RepID=A0A8S1HSK0_9PELO|nr:unnamed protein product [Caenorhabditis auriculariae]